MITDERYRAWVAKQVKDPMVQMFWANEFPRFDKQDAVTPSRPHSRRTVRSQGTP